MNAPDITVRVPLSPSAGKRRVSVCHVASGDLWAGAEAQLAALLADLAQRQELRLAVVLLNEGRLAEEVREIGIELKIIPERQKGLLEILEEATGYLRGREIQVLHSHRYKENILSAWLAWRCHIPFIVRTQHGLPEPRVGLKRWKSAVLQAVDRCVARYSTDRVISVSSELRSHLVRAIHPSKVVVIRNGLAISRVQSDLTSGEAKRRLGMPEDCLVMGTAGRLEPVKRLDLFLEAARRISTRLASARFVIVGEGRERLRVRELACRDGLQDRVLCLGHRDDIYDVLRSFDLFVLCSDHEGLPMALLEALRLGVPVVARRVGGVGEVIEHGTSGLLVESSQPEALAAACLHLLTDEKRRRQFALVGPDWVTQKFSSEETAAEVARLYASLVGAG